jgi:heat shock protein HtpX
MTKDKKPNAQDASFKTSFYSEIEKNKTKSIMLVFVVGLVLLGLFYFIGVLFDPEIASLFMVFGSIVTLAHIWVSYSYGDRIVLSTTNAVPADPIRNRYIIDEVEGLSIAAGIPAPKVFIVKNDDINAFAVGKDPKHASIAVTTGAIQNLDRGEMEGVIGHEISHIVNYDIRFQTLVAVLVGLIGIVSYMLLRSWRFSGGGRNRDQQEAGIILLIIGIVLAIVAPIVSRLVQAAVSRRREFLADANGAMLTRYPDGLADALQKIKDVNEGKMKVSESVSHLFIADPTKSPLDELFATHPPIDQRIKILRAM